MKKNGFTLIEILGVITLLAILSTLIILSVNRSLKESKETLYKEQIEQIKSAADMWRTDNIELIPDNDYYIVSLQHLQDLGYIKSDIINPKTNQLLDKNILIEIGMTEIRIGDASVIAQKTDNYINEEIQSIKNELMYSTKDGVYYYNSQGNLENDSSIIFLTRQWNKPKGNILIHNHQFISGCIQINGINYDIYKTEITKQNYSCSTVRGENLFVNGDLSFKDNTGFSNFTYNFGDGGYLSYTTSTRKYLYYNDYVPIDINNGYEIGAEVKTNNNTALNYMGLALFDVDRNQISFGMLMYKSNTLTTLARDLDTNDEYIYLTDMTNWVSGNNGVIFWNYEDSTGYKYPAETYSQNRYTGLYSPDSLEKNISLDQNDDIIEGQSGNINRIKLNSKWNNGFISAGTQLSQSIGAGTHNYILMDNSNFNLEWTEYLETIDGINITGNKNFSKFAYGIEYVKFISIVNSNDLPDVTTYFKNIYLREVIE